MRAKNVSTKTSHYQKYLGHIFMDLLATFTTDVIFVRRLKQAVGTLALRTHLYPLMPVVPR